MIHETGTMPVPSIENTKVNTDLTEAESLTAVITQLKETQQTLEAMYTNKSIPKARRIAYSLSSIELKGILADLGRVKT